MSDRDEERAALLRVKIERAQAEAMEKMAPPTWELPENINDLLDQKRERLAGGEELTPTGKVLEWLLPEWRSMANAMLKKAESGAGESVGGVLGAIRERTVGGRRTVLSRQHMEQLTECYRQARSMQRISVLPQQAALLAVELTTLADEILQAYGAEALPELALANELSAELLVPLMEWQYNNGYVTRPDEWKKIGKPHMGRIVPMGTPTITGTVVDASGNDAWARPEEQVAAPSHAAFTSDVVAQAASPKRPLPEPTLTDRARQIFKKEG